MVVKYVSSAECGIDHCLVVSEVREAVSINKHSTQKFVVERFNMKKLMEGNVREDYQPKITNTFAALEN